MLDSNRTNSSSAVPPTKNRDAVVYLTRSSQLDLLKRSIDLLCDNFLPDNPADVFVFHEDDCDLVALRRATERANSSFCRVDFSSVPPGCENLSRGQIGYRHMCRFFANEWFLRPELDGYGFVMRMDVDSFILSPCKTDLFATMRRQGSRYAYRAVTTDARKFCTGFWETAAKHFEDSGVVPKDGFRKDFGKPLVYYTNFEICDLSWFRDLPWQSFFKDVDFAGGIAKYRWGDHIIRYAGLQALMDPAEIWQATPLHYQHWYRWKAGSRHRNLPWLLRCYAKTAVAVAKEKLHLS